MHAIRQSAGHHHGVGTAMSRSSSMVGSASVDRHASSSHLPRSSSADAGDGNELPAAPHFFVPTTSSFRKHQREAASTPKSRAELFRSAHSPSRIDITEQFTTTITTTTSSQHSATLERKRSNFIPPSAAESSPETMEGPTEFTNGNYLVASAPNPLHLFGLEKQLVVELQSSSQTIDEASAPGSTASGTPRSGRMDSQRLNRLRQVRLEKITTAPIVGEASTTPAHEPNIPSSSPLRGLTLEDLAKGSLDTNDYAQDVVTVVSTSSDLQLQPEEAVAKAIVVGQVSDPPSPLEQPVDATVTIPELSVTRAPLMMPSIEVEKPNDGEAVIPPSYHVVDEDILSSFGSADGHEGSEEGEEHDESVEEGDAVAHFDEEVEEQLHLSTSSADVVPASSADEVARRHITAAESQTPATASASSSRKRTTVEQMTYRKKKELLEKVRTRQQHQQQHHTVPAGDSRSPPEREIDVSGVRSDGGAANASQSNADADVSKDDEQSRGQRVQREKKSVAVRRRNTVGPISSSQAPPLPPTLWQVHPTHERAQDLQPQPVESEEPGSTTAKDAADEVIPETNNELTDTSSPRRSFSQLPRPRRKSFADASSSAASDSDVAVTPKPDALSLHSAAPTLDDATSALEDGVTSPETAPLCPASATDAAPSGKEPQTSATFDGVEISDDDLDDVFQSVIRERSVVSATVAVNEQPAAIGDGSSIRQQEELDKALAEINEAQAREFSALARETLANDMVSKLEREVEALDERLDEVHQQANEEAESHRLHVQRLEQLQSSLLVALDRLRDAAEIAEDEDDVRREISVKEQLVWNEEILFPFQELQLSLEVLRYESMMEEQAAAHRESWAQQSSALGMNIASLEEQLNDAIEQHELDVGTREAAFEEERVELVQMHGDATDQLRREHATEMEQMVSMHTDRFDTMNASFLHQIDTLTQNHDAELKSTTLHFEKRLDFAEEVRRNVLRTTQERSAWLADSVWSDLKQHKEQSNARSAFKLWMAFVSAAQHSKNVAALQKDHAISMAALNDTLEQVKSEAADEYDKLAHIHDSMVAHSDALQADLDATRESLRLLTQNHDGLQTDYNDLRSTHTEALGVNQSLRSKIEVLENLAHKAENHLLEQRKELFAQESIIVAMKAVQQQSDTRIDRLAQQRIHLVDDLEKLQSVARLRQQWSWWSDPATKVLLHRGTVAVKQNSEAREELQSWREFLLSANSPKSKLRGTPAASSRTASHLSVTSSNHRTASRAPSLSPAAEGDVCELLPGEDDLCVSLKYLLARERTEVAAVKASLVKHRAMLAEGNAAMERMLFEMEILSKQNKELVSLCQRQRLEVPRALQSAEVPRLVQRLLQEEASRKETEQASLSVKQSMNVTSIEKPALHTFSRSEGGDDGYVVD
ncbi:Hypothetical protein, putative [Bodo saltans]|uniref:Uncharacterized protein n=1 Tax=Bodo saltans TaxID=75058 RepID=A0A0S4J9G0_BODSA|nr:Hypothetical protein, putative [Bodo saltans]|eukprot:CUG86761.1 Hypothetical protein, putative [Bodo saltans]